MSEQPQQEASPWGHVILMVTFVVATLAFLFDTLSQSFRLENVIVILPVSGLVLLLCLKQIYKIARNWPSQASTTHSTSPDASTARGPGLVLRPLSPTARTLVLMSLLGLYVLGLTYFYFDVSTLLFIWLALFAQGERRLVFGAVYALLVSWFVVWGLKQMVSFPFDTLMF